MKSKSTRITTDNPLPANLGRFKDKVLGESYEIIVDKYVISEEGIKVHYRKRFHNSGIHSYTKILNDYGKAILEDGQEVAFLVKQRAISSIIDTVAGNINPIIETVVGGNKKSKNYLRFWQ